MAILTNDLIDKYDAAGLTKVSVAAPGAITPLGFSLEADVNDWQNSENLREARAMLVMQFTGSLSSTEPPVVNLYRQARNINGAGNHAPAPSASFLDRFSATFRVPQNLAASTLIQTWDALELLGPLEDQTWRFYLRNVLGAGATLAANWELYIGPATVGPKPAA